MDPLTCNDCTTVNFGDSIPLSTLDWPGRASVVFFLRGCPYRCPYCQNYSILSGSDPVDFSRIEQLIESSRLFVSTVIFSGGEPLQQKDAILALCSLVKDLGLDVGIHTNGAYPDVLEELCKRKLVDGVFIDVKAPLNDPESYGRMIGSEKPSVTILPDEVTEKVRESIEIAVKYGVLEELRTTVLPQHMDSPEEIRSIVYSIAPFLEISKVPYVVQQGLPGNTGDRILKELSPLSRESLLMLSKPSLDVGVEIYVRTREKGSERISFETI
ncbi:pyruvate formate lyase activating enzyme [Methanohalophilus levihalophilus]|uniref:anaerobic ribonucleoside-triphosphate reductase activating protein n=1 Tax=Methanohalophilus levihalophilus TaxID=1431282 RepID=UPI001AEB19E9|nr:anaerobic ribonucleoside-triphosphate reductase activating protein [Methanohalophilus levihalophilus]MBP2030193.1 pyruvate formate lyase activating enzyme [Methanohalophilus levihalophilus]